ncbi:MAG: MFS transporter [Deltaproteobacteria bacterium]|nr:MFS transporter [Deltaproteobacteria bacterium]
MSLAERRGLRLFTLCTLYVAQGIPWGFMATTIPAYLGAHGMQPAAIGKALAMTTLPYAFKWVWGPIIDSFTIPRLGRRRPWIVFAQLMMALTVGMMIAIPDLTLDLKLLAWMILIHTVFNAMQDVAVDGLAVDLLDDDERGRANGLMYAAKYGGGVVGGVGMAKVIHWSSLDTALIVQTGILLAIMLVPLLVRERSGPPVGRPKFTTVMRSLAEVFSIRSAFLMAALMLSIHLGLGVLTANAYALFTQELNWTSADYSELAGGWGLVAGLSGSMLGGVLADVIGRRRMIAIASIAMGVGWIAFAMLEAHWRNVELVYAIALYETAFTSIMSVGLFALCMDVAYPPIGASQFTAYMSLSNFSTTIGFLLTAELRGVLTYRECYIAAGIFQVAIIALLLWIDPTQTRRTLPRPDGARIPAGGIFGVCVLALVLVVSTSYAVYRIVS